MENYRELRRDISTIAKMIKILLATERVKAAGYDCGLVEEISNEIEKIKEIIERNDK